MIKQLIILCIAATVHAEILDSQAVRAIVGEAANQPYNAQVAIGSSLRHRGNLRGVYGFTNSVYDHSTQAVKDKALKAWRESKTNDLSFGCKYFGCPQDYHYFKSIGLKPVVKYGEITFYK